MEDQELIYLDNAATSFPKSLGVIEEMKRFMLYCGGNAGRGSHVLALEAAKTAYDCRNRLSEMFDAEGPERICFTLNTTYALNFAIKGLLKEGDHVLISDLEHNAVLRPIYKLSQQGKISYDVFPSMAGDTRRSAARICAGIMKLLRKETRMLICTGASNVCSVEMPLSEIGALCKKRGILFVVDGAQCAGHRQISMKKMCIDVLCLPAHKGLMGPQGCGIVIFGNDDTCDTLVEGGNGVASLDLDMGEFLPERHEAGTLPLPAIAGLGESLREIQNLGIEEISGHERMLFYRAREQLLNTNGVTVYCPESSGAVLLFNVAGHGSEEVAKALSDAGICVRGGYHCTMLGHKTLGTLEGGAVRASFGAFNTLSDVDMLCSTVRQLSK